MTEHDTLTSDDGEALANALQNLHAAVADAIRERDEFRDAWEARDTEWLAANGYLYRRGK
jgi:hypothetical protein